MKFSHPFQKLQSFRVQFIGPLIDSFSLFLSYFEILFLAFAKVF